MSPTKVFKNANLHIIFGITLSGILGVSSITPAFPEIARAFDISADRVALLITVFTLPGIFLSPVFGVVADRVGRKAVVVPSLFLFGVAGFGCAFTTDFNTLLILRFFQGVGAASMGSLNATMIGDLFRGNDRFTAMGYNSAVLSFGATIYPAIGGALALLGWYFPFYLPIVAIPIGFLVWFKLDTIPVQAKTSMKSYFGNLYKLSKTPEVFSLLLASLVSFMLLYGPILSFIPFYMVDSFGSSTAIIGIVISCMAFTNGIASSSLGFLANRFEPYKILTFSYIIYALAFLLIPVPNSAALLSLPVLLYGLGQGINIPNFLSQLTEAAAADTRAALLSLNGTVLRLGQTVGPSLMAIVFAYKGYEAVFYSAGLLALLMFFVLLFFGRK